MPELISPIQLPTEKEPIQLSSEMKMTRDLIADGRILGGQHHPGAAAVPQLATLRGPARV
jgi:hypothetical protein